MAAASVSAPKSWRNACSSSAGVLPPALTTALRTSIRDTRRCPRLMMTIFHSSPMWTGRPSAAFAYEPSRLRTTAARP